jgi:hypothetical protein
MTKLFAAIVATALAGTAHAATYVSTRTIGTATANLSITTDDTIGTLTADNIVDWAITLTTVSGSASLQGPNSGDTSKLIFKGSALSATATKLQFDFSAAGEAYFAFQSTLGDRSLYCVQTVNCFDQTRGEEIISLGPLFQDFQRDTRTGVVTIASVGGAVPEPANWALMIGGFGIVGGAMRTRRRAVPA